MDQGVDYRGNNIHEYIHEYIYIYIYLDKYLGLYSIYQGVDNVIPIICGFPGNVP